MSGLAFSFVATVGAAEVAGSSSAVYNVTVRTNLAEYREHGERLPASEVQREDEGELEDDAPEDLIVTIPERTITVVRTYTAFREVSLPLPCRAAPLPAAPDAVRRC